MSCSSDYRRQLCEVARFLQQEDDFLLVGHVDPDPDCIGSLLALDWALRQLGKQVTPVSPDPLLPTWSFLPWQERVRLPAEVDAASWRGLVVVDCDIARTGPVAAWAERAAYVVTIDHHVTNKSTDPQRVLHPSAAAAGEIIYDLIETLGLSLDSQVATLLYAAIMTDTGSFRFSNTNARVLAIASDLVAKGAQPHLIVDELYDTRSWSYLRLLRRVLATLEGSAGGKVAWVTLTMDDLAAEGQRQDVSEGFIQYPRMIQGVEVALMFRQVAEREVRVSFRSRRWVDVSAIAQEFGGGGHPKAAGCTVHLPLPEAQALVLQRVLAATGDQLARDMV